MPFRLNLIQIRGLPVSGHARYHQSSCIQKFPPSGIIPVPAGERKNSVSVLHLIRACVNAYGQCTAKQQKKKTAGKKTALPSH